MLGRFPLSQRPENEHALLASAATFSKRAARRAPSSRFVLDAPRRAVAPMIKPHFSFNEKFTRQTYRKFSELANGLKYRGYNPKFFDGSEREALKRPPPTTPMMKVRERATQCPERPAHWVDKDRWQMCFPHRPV